MDRPYDGAYGRISNTSTGRMPETRSSLGPTSPTAPAPSMPQRLQKKQSHAAERDTASGPSTSTTAGGAPRASHTSMASLALGGKTRTGSIRSAMRKIFGRKTRDVDPRPAARASPPRHQYHRSESSALPPPIEIPKPETYESEFSHSPRAFSTESYQLMPPFANKRTGSPYAVQFPKSAQLKPLDLGNPFAAASGNQLRRRKTLPTVLPAELGKPGSAPSSAPLSSHPPPVPPVPRELGLATADVAKPLDRERSQRKSRRRSRSVEDLKRSNGERFSAPRKRSVEIQYWRESVQGDTRQTGSLVGIIPIGAVLGELEEENTPMARPDPFDEIDDNPATIQDSPKRISLLPVDEPEPSTPGTDLTKDLEDRVARLEAGLRTFQRSLQRLTADRNRRTVIMGSMPVRRSSDEARTPSMLADTLLDFQEQTASSPRLPDPQLAPRPSTSPRPSISRPSNDPFTVDFPPLPPSTRPPEPLHYSPARPSASPPPPPRSHRSHSRDDSFEAKTQPQQQQQQQQQQQPYTFSSLYQMLTDERSARRRLETEMRSLREELSDLHSQVALSSSPPPSNLQSQRSSYMPTDPTAGSARLRELLRETETNPSSPSSPAHNSHHHQQNSSSSSSHPPASRWPQRLSEIAPQHQPPPVMTSRFSASEESDASTESELGEPETPLEAYRTPAEEQGRWGFEEVF